MSKIAAIVPAYNEEKAIASVVNNINALAQSLKIDITVVVVNDCSRDSTPLIVGKLNCVLLDLLL